MSSSLGRRIRIWNAVFLAIAIISFGSILYWQRSTSLSRKIDNELTAAVVVIAGRLNTAPPHVLQTYLHPRPGHILMLDDYLRQNPGTSDLENDISSGPEDGRSLIAGMARLDRELVLPASLLQEVDEPPEHDEKNGPSGRKPYLVIRDNDGNFVKQTGVPEEFEFPGDDANANESELAIRFRTRGLFREAYANAARGAFLLVGRHTGGSRRELFDFALLIAGAGTGVWLIGLAGGWFLSRSSTRPIDEISGVAADISGRNLDRRIEVDNVDVEFKGLASTLNAMFGRLDSSFQRQQRFTADASHELRTPLAVLKTHQDLALSKPRSAGEYRETLEICSRSTQRMNSLVESLLILARMDGSRKVEMEPFAIDPLIRNEVEKLEPLFARNGIDVQCDLQPLTVIGKPNSIGQVLTNLLTNALSYSPEGGKVVVRLRRDGNMAGITVSDQGSGVPEEAREKIFERFFRLQQERSRNSGGSGLGLAICKGIVQAHGGTIGVSENEGGGAVFRFSIPLDSKSANSEPESAVPR